MELRSFNLDEDHNEPGDVQESRDFVARLSTSIIREHFGHEMKKLNAKFNFQMLLNFQLKLFQILFKDYNINKEEMKYIFSQVETIENLLIFCFYRKLRSIYEINVSVPSLSDRKSKNRE